MRARLLLAALLGLAFACGVRGNPRPPRPDLGAPPAEEPCDAGCCR